MIVSNLCDSIEHAEVSLETTFHPWDHSNIACETNTKLAVSNLGVYSSHSTVHASPNQPAKVRFPAENNRWDEHSCRIVRLAL